MGQKSKFHELAGAPFHVFGGRAVIKDNERVGAFKINARHIQPIFYFAPLADDDTQPLVPLSEALL